MQDLGLVTAYAYAVSGGYTGTKEEFAELMASYAEVAEQAEASAEAAATSATQAAASATQAGQSAINAASSASAAGTSASNAQTAAGNAAQSRTDAAGSATAAANSASQAAGSASGAAASATAASGSASAAEASKTAAQTAQTAAETARTGAETAQGAAEDAQTAAETAAASVTASAAQITQNAEDITDLKSDLNNVNDWLGHAVDLIDARDFAISNSNNWSIDSATRDSITITHKTQWTTGEPKLPPLDVPSGDYVFYIEYDGTEIPCSLKVDGNWKQTLTNGVTVEIDSTKENVIYFGGSAQGTFIVSSISLFAKDPTGKIPTLEANFDAVESDITKASQDIVDLQEGFADIASPVIEEMSGEETQSRAIRGSTGELIDAGYSGYRIIKYSVVVGKDYWITANANYSNCLWCFYDSNDAVVQKGTQAPAGSAFTTVENEKITTPTNATTLVIAYNVGEKQGLCKTQNGFSLKKKWADKKWVCVGDSLTAVNIRTTKHYFDYVAEETGITTVNMGDSGSGYARASDRNAAFYQRISNCPTDADVVTIFGSFNDLGAGLQIGDVNDSGTDTLAGCINTTITNLQTIIPLVNLGIVAPTPWNTTQPSTSGNAYNYVNMLKAICERRSIPFLDLWHCSNLRPWDADFRELAYSKDEGSGTHPDETGHQIIAPRFKAFLETLLM